MTVVEERLPSFENHQVVRSAVKITRAGDGLSEALKLEPQALQHGDEVFFVLRGEVTQVTHRPASKEESDILARVHVVEAREIALVHGSEVEHLFASERTRLKKLKDAAESRAPLPGLDGEDEGEPNMFGGVSGGTDLPAGDVPPPTKTRKDSLAAHFPRPTRPRKGSLEAQLAAIAEATDPAELFALMDSEEKGKGRAQVLDAARARVAELADS